MSSWDGINTEHVREAMIRLSGPQGRALRPADVAFSMGITRVSLEPVLRQLEDLGAVVRADEVAGTAAFVVMPARAAVLAGQTQAGLQGPAEPRECEAARQ